MSSFDLQSKKTARIVLRQPHLLGAKLQGASTRCASIAAVLPLLARPLVPQFPATAWLDSRNGFVQTRTLPLP